MKKIIVSLLLTLILGVCCNAQRMKYSLENLEKSTPEQLEILKQRAIRDIRAGAVLTSLGVISFGALLIYPHICEFDDVEVFLLSVPTLFVGTICILGGIPRLIIGKVRVDKVNSVLISNLEQNMSCMTITIKPDIHYSSHISNYSAGIKLTIQF